VTDQDGGIAKRLRLAREQAGLSQGQTANIMGLHRPSISEMEAGHRKVSAEELARLAEIYHVSISWLATGKPDSEGEGPVELAARALSKMKRDELDRLIELLTMIRGQRGGEE
jgi:transcriptional regulator with XRE-family HTH domain